jgi:RNA polymerase sigma factor (sigma-70 family)
VSSSHQQSPSAGSPGYSRVAALFRSAAAGDQEAWDGLVREFGGTIRGIARRYRLGEADAADVEQATWLRLLLHTHDVNDPSCLGAWLATTARRECLRVLHHSSRQILLGDELPEIEAPAAAVDDRLLTNERDAALWASFDNLVPADRTLLQLCIAEPRPSYREISAATGMPVGSIGPTRQRALGRLLDELIRTESVATVTA